MSAIRKRSLVGAFWIYIGFAIGALNTFLFASKSFFIPQQYGLTRTLIDLGGLLAAFAAMGCFALIIKFFPYYHRQTTTKKTDFLAIPFILMVLGNIAVLVFIFLGKDLFMRKFITNAPAVLSYYYWLIPFFIGIVWYNFFEYHAWNYHLQIQTNILREVVLRIYVLVLIILKIADIINIDLFIKLFSFQYVLIALWLAIILLKKNALQIQFSISRLTKRYKKLITTYVLLSIMGLLVQALRNSIDSMVLASYLGTDSVAIFSFCLFVATLVVVPFRSIASISLPILSKAWKEKDFNEIDRLYKRSSINLLLFGLLILGIVWLCFEPCIHIFNINKNYLKGQWPLLLIGLGFVAEMGSGINGQIIATSTKWYFEFYTNLVYGVIITFCSFLFTKYFGWQIYGPAVAGVIGLLFLNAARIIYLYNKFKLFPFSVSILKAFALFVIGLIPGLLLTIYNYNYWFVLVAVAFFVLVMTTGVLWLRLSPDVAPVLNNVFKRLRLPYSIK
jgi:O-antigen/teichoic acid export membrane protein